MKPHSPTKKRRESVMRVNFSKFSRTARAIVTASAVMATAMVMLAPLAHARPAPVDKPAVDHGTAALSTSDRATIERLLGNEWSSTARTNVSSAAVVCAGSAYPPSRGNSNYERIYAQASTQCNTYANISVQAWLYELQGSRWVIIATAPFISHPNAFNVHTWTSVYTCYYGGNRTFATVGKHQVYSPGGGIKTVWTRSGSVTFWCG